MTRSAAAAIPHHTLARKARVRGYGVPGIVQDGPRHSLLHDDATVHEHNGAGDLPGEAELVGDDEPAAARRPTAAGRRPPCRSRVDITTSIRPCWRAVVTAPGPEKTLTSYGFFPAAAMSMSWPAGRLSWPLG